LVARSAAAIGFKLALSDRWTLRRSINTLKRESSAALKRESAAHSINTLRRESCAEPVKRMIDQRP
jgi:hypothetical protein